METHRKNKLPEGVGKKIVEALKQQNNIAINEVNEVNVTSNAQYSAWDNAAYQNKQLNPTQSQNSFEHSNQTTENQEFYREESISSINQNVSQPPNPSINNFNVVPQQSISNAQTIQSSSFNNQPINQNSVLSSSNKEILNTDFELPANIEMIKRLISQLPAGVTRQTGAQIIRQTMEAMGLSINNVLSEAQMVQENLGSSVKDSVNTIEEYKNNIKILERKIQSYKKQADQLGELINLFILSEK